MMATPSHDIFHLIYDRSPVWLAHLRTISKDVDRRHADLLAELDLPALWQFGSDANLTASALSLFDSAPPLTFSGSTIPHSSHKTDHSSQPAKRTRTNSTQNRPAADHSRRRSQHIYSQIVYDGCAQAMLADIVKEVSRAVNIINKSANSHELRDISTRLLRASDFCEDAAFQLLRDGQCDPHSSSASAIFQDLFVISCIEVMHERKDRELKGIDITPLALEPINLPSPSKNMHIPAVQVADLEDPLDEIASLNSLDDIPIGPIRLTSRIR